MKRSGLRSRFGGDESFGLRCQGQGPREPLNSRRIVPD